MGSGKSSFGKKIAHHFNIEHIDTDKEISKFENATINEIFSLKGLEIGRASCRERV